VPPNKRGKKSEQSGDADVDVDDDDKNSKDPLSALTNKAGKSNPSQFELPKELTSHILLPGWVHLLAFKHWLLKSKSFGKLRTCVMVLLQVLASEGLVVMVVDRARSCRMSWTMASYHYQQSCVSTVASQSVTLIFFFACLLHVLAQV
jgi:hypothetical protein